MTKTAQVLVKDVKMLLDAMSKDRDTLTEAAQEIANTVSRLSDEVKLAAASLTSDNQTGQVRTFLEEIIVLSVVFLSRFLF